MTDRRSLIDRLADHAAAFPDRTALIHDEDGTIVSRRSYAQLMADVRRAAAGLSLLAYGGRRIGLLFQPGAEFVVAFLAVLATGGVAVPLAPLGRRRERVANLLPVIRDCQPQLLLVDAAMAGQYGADLGVGVGSIGVSLVRFDQLPDGGAQPLDPVSPDALAVLQYTSGSTSTPKGVMISHGNIMANQAMIAEAFRHDERSTFVGWAPHFHDQGLFGNIVQPLWLGATCVLTSPSGFVRKPLSWLEMIARHGAHTSGGPNFAFDLCVEHAGRRGLPDVDLACWKVAFNGAEPIRAGSLRAFAATFAPIGFRAEALFPCYGLAECTVVAVCGPRDTAPVLAHVDVPAMGDGRIESPSGLNPALAEVCCGPAMAGGEVLVVDPASRTVLPDGQTGEIWLAGPHVGQGYLNRREATERTFGARTADGRGPYLRTGDIGFRRPEGYYIVGRIKDLIIVNGRNHAPSDVEQLWGEVTGKVGQAIAAAFEVRRGTRHHVVLVAELDRAARRRTGDGMVDEGLGARVRALAARVRTLGLARLDLSISDLVLVDAGGVPRTTSGKVRRATTRDRLMDGSLPVLCGTGALSATLGLDDGDEPGR